MAELEKRGGVRGPERVAVEAWARALDDLELAPGLVVSNVADRADPPTAKMAKAPEPTPWKPDQLGAFLAAAEQADNAAVWLVLDQRPVDADSSLRPRNTASISSWISVVDLILEGADQRRRGGSRCAEGAAHEYADDLLAESESSRTRGPVR